MSGVVITRRLLTDSAALVILVPATRIIAGVIPQGTALPCIAVTEVSSTDRHTLKGVAFIKVTERDQVTVMAANYPAVKDIMRLVRKACRNVVGTVGAYPGVTCHLQGKGPDFIDPDAGFYMQSQDTLVTFNEAA